MPAAGWTALGGFNQLSNKCHVLLTTWYTLVSTAPRLATCCGRYAVVALTDIPSGTELTISYTGDDPDMGLNTPSLELLMTWGFTQTANTQPDPILPMQYYALPGLDWDVVVSAAAAVMQKHARGTAVTAELQQLQTVSGPWAKGDTLQQLQALLPAAASNLPLLQGNTTGSSGSGSLGSTSPLYRRAAEVISSMGMQGSICVVAHAADPTSASSSSSSSQTGRLVRTAGVAPRQLQLQAPVGSTAPINLEAAVTRMPAWLVYERPFLTQMQLQELQTDFWDALQDRLSALDRLQLIASTASPAVGAAAVLPLAFLQGLLGHDRAAGRHSTQGHSRGRERTALGSQRLQAQLLVATALLCEVQFMLLQSGTTVLQDEAVLAFLLGKEEQNSTLLTQQPRPAPVVVSLQHSFSHGLPMSADHAPARSDVAAAAGGDDSGRGAVTGREAEQQWTLKAAAVQIFKARQLDILRQLMLLHAGEVALHTSGHSTAAGGNLSAQQAATAPTAALMWAAGAGEATAVGVPAAHPFSSMASSMEPAALKVLRSLNHYSNAMNLPMSGSLLRSSSNSSRSGGQSQPESLMSLAEFAPAGSAAAGPGWEGIAAALSHQEQQINTWQRQQQRVDSRTGLATSSAACHAAVADAAALLAAGQVSRARLTAAVAARLQHKRLLQTDVELLLAVQHELRVALS